MSSFTLAAEAYAECGVDVEQALARLAKIPISLHCWQGDDVNGFENGGSPLSGGIQTTGNYPGKARNSREVMDDLDVVYSLIPGAKRLSLHAIYAIADGSVERDRLEPEHFEAWLQWGKARSIHLDFNPTLFSHPMHKDGMTLAHPDKEVRQYWIRHVKACRKISAYLGEQQGTPCLHNIWLPDGLKDLPADRLGPRQRLVEALDEILSVKYDKDFILDAVESKVFGIGLESYTVGSNEFYLLYAATRGINALLDSGHYHPTETVADKIPSILAFFDKVALHVTRAVRWDSDHVVLLDDETKEIAKEIIRNDADGRVLIGLDYFDASINRVAAWIVGARSMQKALLSALLIPYKRLKELQDSQNFTKLMVLNEEIKTMPLGAVWDEYCRRQGVLGADWFAKVQEYEKNVLSKRS
ncbi:MAG: L-rhamnose isomerase [Clostridiales bacterium]|jgi:L-rhamnose isomerase|nr:L-rhamnose isomerase [Clostridiales bacterium]